LLSDKFLLKIEWHSDLDGEINFILLMFILTEFSGAKCSPLIMILYQETKDLMVLSKCPNLLQVNMELLPFLLINYPDLVLEPFKFIEDVNG
jgi:hypothetical protein